MCRRTLLFAAALLLPLPAVAQGISGAADWTYGRNTTTGGESTNTTGSLTQTYTAGYRSVFWDPRFMQYNGDVTLRKIGMNWNDQKGRLSDTGYRFGATLFNGRPFPLAVSAFRGFGLESGNLPSGNVLRGGLVLPPGDEMPGLHTRTTGSSVLWQLDTKRLPKLELGYRRAASSISVADQTVSQRDRLLSLLASRKTGPLSNQLRFQKTSFENEFSTDFTQRLTELAYEGNAAIGRTLRTTSRAGTRRMFSLFDTPLRMTDFGRDAFAAPARGDSTLRYATQSVSWQATSRLGTDLTLSYDTSSSSDVSTGALLVSGMVRYQIVKGLLVDVTGTNGTRTQTVRGSSLDALTRAATSGVSYTFSVPHLQFGGSLRGGRGRATSADGQAGNSTLWNGQASVSSDVLRWIDLGALYEKGRTTDDLFVFGNYTVERRRLTARGRLGARGSIEADWEHSTQARGRGVNLQWTDLLARSLGGSFLLSRAHRLAFSAGTFRNTYERESDSSRFADVNYDGRLTARLHATGSLRWEIGRRRSLDQDGYVAIGKLEYGVRMFTFGLEQRLMNIDYSIANRDPFRYQGNSFLMRIGRKFGGMF